MRPITVNVGPLGATSNLVGAVAIGQSGLVNMGQTPTGGSNTSAWVGGGTLANGILTVTSTVSGGPPVPGPLTYGGMLPGTRIVGPGPSANTWRIYPDNNGRTFIGSLRQGQVITLDAPRQIVINNTEAAGTNSFTVNGTDAAGNPISETLVSTGAAVTTSQSFATVTSVTIANPLVAAITSVATAATATSPWVYFDPYVSGGYISKQTVVTGVANYTVQLSYDDPNAPGGVAPGAMGWLNDTDATFVGATTSLTGSWPYTPLWARVLLNSGAGSVRATFIQPGNLGR